VIVENSSVKAAPLAVKIANYYLTQLSDNPIVSPKKNGRKKR